MVGYLKFLKELAAAEDREGFLAGADEGMVGVMRQLEFNEVEHFSHRDC